jgi:hypothetical protein
MLIYMKIYTVHGLIRAMEIIIGFLLYQIIFNFIFGPSFGQAWEAYRNLSSVIEIRGL